MSYRFLSLSDPLKEIGMMQQAFIGNGFYQTLIGLKKEDYLKDRKSPNGLLTSLSGY
jgi:hypothetical protein